MSIKDKIGIALATIALLLLATWLTYEHGLFGLASFAAAVAIGWMLPPIIRGTNK